MGPSNAILGDGTGVDLPQATPDENALNEEKKLAKYSKTAEFKRIQDYFQDRILFYQKFLPDGRPIATAQPSLEDWRVANLLITEFQAIINLYENAAVVVEADAAK